MAGNIYWSMSNYATYTVVGNKASDAWYYIPNGVMQFALIFGMWAWSTTMKRKYQEMRWSFFVVMAFGQLTKFVFSDPEGQQFDDYIFGFLAITISVGRIIGEFINDRKLKEK